MSFSNPDLPIPIICALGLVLLIVSFELKRASKRRFWRIFMSLLLVASLFMLYAKPVYTATSFGSNLILLTQNYNENLFDSLKRSLPNAEVVHWDSIDHAAVGDRHLYLVGTGVPTYDIWKLEENKVTSFFSPNHTGFNRINYTKKLFQDEELAVSGKYFNLSGDSLLIKLTLFNETLDSIYISGIGDQFFDLGAIATTVGRFEYRLETIDSNGVVTTKEVLPVEINPRSVYKVLALTAFPSFEIRYFKNFLAKEGHELVIRNQVSRGIFSYAGYNTDIVYPRRIDENALERFDLLVLDLESLQSLSRLERGALERSIAGGLGVFLLPEDGLFDTNSKLLPNFIETSKKQTPLKSSNNNLNLASFPKGIELEMDNEEVVFDQSIIGFKKHVGKGKVGGSYLKTTYTLRLRGDSIAYKGIWRSFVEELTSLETPVKYMHNYFPVVNDPLKITISSIYNLKVKYNDEGVGIQESPVAGVGNITIWPSNEGWNYLDVFEDTFSERYWFYVFSRDQWSSVRSFKRQTYNKDVLNESRQLEKKSVVKTTEINRAWFYLTILFCFGYLWMEPKL